MGRAYSTNRGRRMHLGYCWERQRPLGRRRRMRVQNMKTDLKRDKMGWYGLDRAGLV
jgi:hypothetical protein